MNHSVSIIKGTAILSIAGLVVKLFGAGYRIYLSRLIGAEGIGLYQMAYPIYLIFLSLATAGIPVAVSKLVAEKLVNRDESGARRVFQAALALMLLLGISGSLGMVVSAPWIAGHLVADQRAVYSIWALAPSIGILSLTGVFRGYFQGRLSMEPSAFSQIYEQMVRVGVSLVLATILMKWGIEHAAAGAAFGTTAGGAAGLIYLVILYLQAGTENKRIFWRISKVRVLRAELKSLIRFALPVSAIAILMPLLQTLDSILVPRSLQSIGYTISQATGMLGVLGNSWAVIYLPLIVIGAIEANLIPSIAALAETGKVKAVENRISEGLRISLIYLIPATVGLFSFGEVIYRIIYGQSGITVLSWFAPALFCLGMERVSSGILHGMGKSRWPLCFFLLGAAVKVMVTVNVTGWPGLNLAGAAIGTACGSLVTSGLNLLKIRSCYSGKNHRAWTVFVAGGVMLWVCHELPRRMAWLFWQEFIISGLVGVGAYLAVLLLLGGIGQKDLELIRDMIKGRGKCR